MANLSITAADVREVPKADGLRDLWEGPAAETIVAGQYVRQDTSTGKVTLGKGTSAAEARKGGIALNGGIANENIRVLRKGYVELGESLVSENFDADIFLSDTDGTLAQSQGTVALVVGTVFPAWAGSTTLADRVLRVDL